MSVLYLIIGTNENDRLNNIIQARHFIADDIGTILLSSSLYETEPWGFLSEINFYNQVVEVKTSLTYYEVLKKIKIFEESMGRIRTQERYTSRIIDIDILFYDNIIIHNSDLVIPHPRISERRFVLEPMKEIAMDFVHPKLLKSMNQLYDECKEQSNVWKVDSDLRDIQE